MESQDSGECENRCSYSKRKKVSSFIKKCIDIIRGLFELKDIKSLIISAVTALVVLCINAYFTKPDIKILGVMPMTVTHSPHKTAEPPFSEFLHHDLRLIIKVENKSAISVPVHLVKIEGCVKIPPTIADQALPKEKQFKRGPTKGFFEKYKNAVRRLEYSGLILEGTNVIPQHSIAYIGITFPIEGQAAIHSDYENEKSISIEGRCSDIKVPHPQMSLIDFFGEKIVPERPPKKLRQEIRDGSLRMSLFAGTERIAIEPGKIGKLRHLGKKTWGNLALPQMYESPDDEYFPPKK